MDPVQPEDAPLHDPAPSQSGPKPKSRDLDRLLTLGIGTTLIAIVALGAFFAYSYQAQKKADRLANPALQAVDTIRAQVKAKPGDAELHSRLAEALATAGELDEAKAQLIAAIKLDPKYIGAYQNLATIELEQELYEDSAKHWQKVLDLTKGTQMEEINQRRELAYFNLGQIAMLQKDFVGAVGYFNASLRIKKDASDTYLLLAKSYMELDQNEQALEKVNAALAFEPNYAEAHYVRGLLYRAAGDLVDAAWDFRAAADRAPDNPEPQAAIDSLGSFESWYGKAQTAWSSRDTSAALDAVRIARSITPGSYEAAMLHGQIAEATGRAKDAVGAYEAALNAKPKDPAATVALKRAKSAIKE
jgi:tetratricopeptide (TPR) repeat protein